MGYPEKEELLEILRENFTLQEVEVVLATPTKVIPFEPVPVSEITPHVKIPKKELEPILSNLAHRGLLFSKKVATDPKRWVDVERDRITLDGKPLSGGKKIYLVLYKPKGYVATRRDERGRKTVYDLLPKGTPYVFSVGRLDLETSGLLLLTNDTAFAHKMASPEHHVPKPYQVKASSHLSDEQLELLRRGIELKDGPTRPATVERLRESGGRTVFTITITEGPNRQVRRMVEALGAKLLKLVRIAIGPLRIGTLPIGACRVVSMEELRGLHRAVASIPSAGGGGGGPVHRPNRSRTRAADRR